MIRISKLSILLIAVVLPYLLKSLDQQHLINCSTWQTTTVAFLTMLTVRFTWNSILYPFYFSALRHLPQPKQTSFLMGQFYRIANEPAGWPARDWTENIENSGLIYYRSMFNAERVLVTTPKALSDALTTKNYDLVKPSSYTVQVARLLGAGLLLAENEEHKRQRKILMPAFAYRHIKDLYPLFWDKARDMILAIDKAHVAQEGGRRSGASHTVRVERWISRATLDIIGIAGFGKSFNAIEDENAPLYRTYQTVLREDSQARVISLLKLFLPFWLVRRLPIPHNFRSEKARSFIRSTCLDLIAEKKVRIAETKEKGGPDAVAGVDILTLALKSDGFTDHELVEQLMTFLVAGHETTATAMTWAVFTLCKHPDVQQRLRKELRSSGLPNARDPEGNITAEQVDHVSYLQAVTNEVLRVYAPIPLNMRVAQRETVLCDQTIPKGTNVVIAPIATNHWSALWGKDSGKFNPDRWLDNNGRAIASGGAESNYANMTFSHGPHNCIGAGFAKAEFACMLAAWVMAFDTVLVDPNMKVEVTAGLVQRLEGGLVVNITPLSRSG